MKNMSYTEKGTMIHAIMEELLTQGFEPSSIVYSDSEIGRITMRVLDITEDPEVVFEVLRYGEKYPERFSNLRIALVHLYNQTPHIQRKETR